MLLHISFQRRRHDWIMDDRWGKVIIVCVIRAWRGVMLGLMGGNLPAVVLQAGWLVLFLLEELATLYIIRFAR